jgi:hypothetical protein
MHEAEGTPVSYRANPPASGNHWPVWQTPWQAYTTAVPRERWVHNLEHGGIVLSYHCQDGCPEVVAELTALRNATAPDQYNEQRVLITPDPLMPKRVAALAWGWRWQGDAVDSSTIQCFIRDRYDRGPESIP